MGTGWVLMKWTRNGFMEMCFFRGRWKWRWDRELSNELGEEAKSNCRELQQRREERGLEKREGKKKRGERERDDHGNEKEKRKIKQWAEYNFLIE